MRRAVELDAAIAGVGLAYGGRSPSGGPFPIEMVKDLGDELWLSDFADDP